MAILSKADIDRLQMANADYKAAGKEFVDACCLMFKPGAFISWRTRGYAQSGFVISNFRGTAPHPGIRVQNIRTGKVVSISFHDINWDRMLKQADNFEEVKKEVGE